VLVLKALVGLCTMQYKAFPTSIQQDRALLGQLATQQPPQQQPQQVAPGGGGGAASSSSGGAPGQRNAAAPAAAGGGDGGSEDAERVARERLLCAVRFRLGTKLLLERATLGVLQRLKALSA
jgi:hypothetical protein